MKYYNMILLQLLLLLLNNSMTLAYTLLYNNNNIKCTSCNRSYMYYNTCNNRSTTATSTQLMNNLVVDIKKESSMILFAEKESDVSEYVNDNDNDIFADVAWHMVECLTRSDIKRDAKVGVVKGDDNYYENNNNSRAVAKGAGNWVDDASAYNLKSIVNKIEVKLPDERSDGLDRDEAARWLRWMKAVPDPMIVELSRELREIATNYISDEKLALLDSKRDTWLNRLGCRLVLLPSGSALKYPLKVPSTGGVAYGKLLYGGVKRFRLLPSGRGKNKSKRRTSENVAIKVNTEDSEPCWLQYGGPDRNYEALDMGSCAVIEFIILPKGQQLPSVFTDEEDMALSRLAWKPSSIFKAHGQDTTAKSEHNKYDETVTKAMGLSGKERNIAFEESFKTNVGGLGLQIDMIVRRVLDGRILKPADEEKEEIPDDESWNPNHDLGQVKLEAEALETLGLTPVRGLLLYGPPGCGKTALAREISKCLRARVPKIVSTPELLDRWVGGSEKLVRGLFKEAEAELAAVGGDVKKSALHVIVLDEIDAVFRKRTSAGDSGEATRSSVVNQILAKLDGVNAIPNILLIGMTNRRELLDDALLRPGRLEVQVEIPLPDREGRREILNIHFGALRRMGKLSPPLCKAIDRGGKYTKHANPEINSIEGNSNIRKRERLFRSLSRLPVYDLAEETRGYSGADIAGLVRCAGSRALARTRIDGSDVDGILLTLEDVKDAMKEMQQ